MDKRETDGGDYRKNIKELTAKLISRVPYKALVADIKEGEIIINAGRFHGIDEGSKLSIFEIKGIKRHPFTNEIINIEREDIGELTAVKVEGAITSAKIKEIKKGKRAEVNNKIDFKPSLKVIADSSQRKKEFLTKKGERGCRRNGQKRAKGRREKL